MAYSCTSPPPAPQLEGTYAEPVVIVGPPTFVESTAASARVRNLTSTGGKWSFELRLQEVHISAHSAAPASAPIPVAGQLLTPTRGWACLKVECADDDIHVSEAVDWMTIEVGVYSTVVGGGTVQVGGHAAQQPHLTREPFVSTIPLNNPCMAPLLPHSARPPLSASVKHRHRPRRCLQASKFLANGTSSSDGWLTISLGSFGAPPVVLAQLQVRCLSQCAPSCRCRVS